MIAYEAIGPNANGDFIIAYPTPGAPQILTAAGVASSEQAAKAECARLNEAQVVQRRNAMVRKANMIIRDREN
jgi:hypothetical protein